MEAWIRASVELDRLIQPDWKPFTDAERMGDTSRHPHDPRGGPAGFELEHTRFGSSPKSQD